MGQGRLGGSILSSSTCCKTKGCLLVLVKSPRFIESGAFILFCIDLIRQYVTPREIDIEYRLTRHLSGGEFERFGNQYLRYYYNDKYPQTKLGLQVANNSTVTGQPDMFFSLPDHTFRFAEFTAQKGSIYTKLKKDVKSCLDEQAHGVDHDRIKHIDLVYTGKLDARQQGKLSESARIVGISVTFHGLDQLVNAVMDDIRLAKALGMPIETGQILTVAEFIEDHERSRLSVGTPLSNAYLERDEYKLLTEQLNSSDIVVIRGQPGYGKTKLALEYQQCYMTDRPGSEGYCIVNQPTAIWDDVLTYFPDGKDYVILIDDANRQVENLSAILYHFDKRLRGSTYKILITVRSYAYEDVCHTLRANAYLFNQLTVGHMTDEQITEVLKSTSFNILNGVYHHKINKLAQGNIRLAIMLATLSKQEGSDITILLDVSVVYDEYYKRVMTDQTVWTDVIRLRVLGLTAVLRVVDTTNPADIEPMLAFLDITTADLWGHVRYLETLEIVEVYQDNAFRFTEQVFATYAFYQCFFIHKALDLTKLLTVFNENNGYRLKDSILSVYESYNKESVRAVIQPILIKFYVKLKHDKSRLSFLSIYDRFLLDEIIHFIFDFVEDRVTSDMISQYRLSADKQIMDLLFNYLTYTHKKADAFTGYELIVALLNKQSVILEDIGKKIETYLVHRYDFAEYDKYGGYYEQYDWLSKYLTEWANKGSDMHCQLMDISLRHFLMLVYDKPGEKPVYRERIWDYVDTRLTADIEAVKVAVYEYMPKSYGNLGDEEIQADIDEVTNVIRNHFSPDNPLDCRNVHAYVNKLNKLSLKHHQYRSLTVEFDGELYRLYCTLNFEYIKKRERIEIDIAGSTELRKRKIDEIRAALPFSNLDEFKPLYEEVRLMWSLVIKPGDGWNISEGLTEFFLSIAERDTQLFIGVLKYVISVGLPDGYWDQPPLLATILEREYVKSEDLYTALLPLTDKTAPWLLSLFWSLPKSEINAQWLYRLGEHLPDFAFYESKRIAISGFLKRYVAFDSTLPSNVLRLLCDVRSKHKKDISLWDDFIEEFGLLIDSSLTNVLEELYLDQNLTKQGYDYDRKALAILLDRRRGFWIDFLNAHYAEGYSRHDFGQLSFVWSREDYYELITEGLWFIEQHKAYMIHSREVEGFFENLSENDAKRVGRFLERFIKENSQELDLLNAIYIALSKPGPSIGTPFIKLFLTCNTSVEDFAKIDWIRASGVRTVSAGTIIGHIHAREWEGVLASVEAMANPLTYLRHRQHIKNMIAHEIDHGDYEKRVNFLRSR